MSTYRSLIILLSTLFLQSCAFAPFSNTYSARTMGKGKISIQASAAGDLEIPAVRIGYGIHDNVDLGFIAEHSYSNLFGGWLKCAFINNDKGLSLSMEASGGGSNESTYFYVGPIIGYKLNWFEPYIGARYNYTVTKNVDLGFLGKYNLNHSSFQYGSLTLGSTIWATNWLGFNVNLNTTFGDIIIPYYGVGFVVEF